MLVLFCSVLLFQKAKKALTTLPWERGENNRPAALAQSRRGENVLRQLVKSRTPEAPTTQRNVAVWEPTHSHPIGLSLSALCPCALSGQLV